MIIKSTESVIEKNNDKELLTQIEDKNKEIAALSKKIQKLILYMRRKDDNILILNEDVKMLEKENSDLKINNEFLVKDNQRILKLNTGKISNKEIDNIIKEQKEETEILRKRFNNLYKEFNEYKKRNAEFLGDYKKIQDTTISINFGHSNEKSFVSMNNDDSYAAMEKLRKTFNSEMIKLSEKVELLQKENDNLKNILMNNNNVL